MVVKRNGEIAMRQYVILKLKGPMQAWGGQSFEGLRHSELFPGRSGLLGLLGACLGVDRNDQERLKQLAKSIGFTVRIDDQKEPISGKSLLLQKMTDYHTVKNARVDYRSLKSHDTIQTWREYVLDACYSIAIWTYTDANFSLQQIIEGVQKPIYTPVLGRRSCPLTRPLYEAIVKAECSLDALRQIEPFTGIVYSEEQSDGAELLYKRDVPIVHQPRQFATRQVYMSKM